MHVISKKLATKDEPILCKSKFKYFYSQMTFFSAGKFVTTEKGSLKFLAQKIAF